MGSRRKYWTVVRTKFDEESTALRNVREQGFEGYLPRYRDRVRGGVRKVLPLFPGYMFVQIKRNQDWSPIRSTRGVHSMMFSGQAPARVLDEDIERIRGCEDELGYVVIPENEPPQFLPGEIVMAFGGMFVNKLGTYVGLGANRHRGQVIFELLGRAVRTDVSLYDLA